MTFSGWLNCKKDEFACRIQRCVSLQFRCNGVDDCGDGSDEASCQDCAADSFFCEGTSSCVPRAKLCDGLFDCPDGQDEGAAVCPSAQPLTPHTCSISEFRCGDGQCVPHSWRCDHSPDCADGSDEDNCGEILVLLLLCCCTIYPVCRTSSYRPTEGDRTPRSTFSFGFWLLQKVILPNSFIS